MNYKISVIIPIYNMEKYLGNCLDSVLSQTLQDIEIICIDDGSTDNTHIILERYEEKYTNIVVLHQNRKGSGSARNAGIECANGKFIAFMDSDDYYASNDVLEVLYDYAVQNNVKVAGGNILRDIEGEINCRARKFRQKHRFVKNEIINFEDYQFCWGYTGFIYNREMLQKNGISFPLYIRGQDPPFMLHALSCANKIGAVSKDVYVARSFDKKIKYNSVYVINDVAKSLCDIILFAIRHDYTNLIETVAQVSETWKIYFLLHIINGNVELKNIFVKIDCELLNFECTKPKGYYFDMSLDDMKDYIEKYVQGINRYIRLMENYTEIIIYGAGEVGKSIYDLIEKRDNLNFLGFAVSSNTAQGTARGEAIRGIETFVNKKDVALVVIAAMQRTSEEMETMAKALGFKNCLTINEALVDVENFSVSNDRFSI